MKEQGVVLKRLRKLQGLTLRQAGVKIGKSVGWLSEIENDRGRATISDQEFDRIIEAYEGQKYKSSFGGWVRMEKDKLSPVETNLDGAIYKHMRTKARLSIRAAAKILNISTGKLCKIEAGNCELTKGFKDILLAAYGYSPVSFKNFRLSGSQSQAVGMKLRLNVLIRMMDNQQIERMFHFGLSLINESSRKVENVDQKITKRIPGSKPRLKLVRQNLVG